MHKIGEQNSGRVRHEQSQEADFRYGCNGIYKREDIVFQMTYALQAPEYEIFSKGDIGIGPLSYSSRSGFCMFNLTSKAEEIIKQMVYEYNAEQMLKSDEQSP
jgi:hypothetical protein